MGRPGLLRLLTGSAFMVSIRLLHSPVLSNPQWHRNVPGRPRRVNPSERHCRRREPSQDARAPESRLTAASSPCARPQVLLAFLRPPPHYAPGRLGRIGTLLTTIYCAMSPWAGSKPAYHWRPPVLPEPTSVCPSGRPCITPPCVPTPMEGGPPWQAHSRPAKSSDSCCRSR